MIRMAFTLPRFSLQSIMDIKRAIRIVNSAGVILPIIFISDKEDCSWEVPQHPVDANMKISDTVWSTPARLSLDGYVGIMKYPLVLQMIDAALKSNQLWTVYYMGGVYQNMEFVSLSKTAASDNATSYKIQIEMQQIPFVMPLTTVITAEQVREVQDAETTLLGQTQTQQKSDTSIAYSLREKGVGFSDFLGGIF